MIYGKKLERATEAKSLDSIVNDALRRTSHCESLVKKSSSVQFLFETLRSVFSVGQLLSMYHSLVELLLRYAISLWGSSPSATKVFVS